MSDCESENLLLEDVIDPLLKVRDFVRESDDESLDYFPQEDSGFAGRVEKFCVRVREDFGRQQVQHVISDFRRREDLIA